MNTVIMGILMGDLSAPADARCIRCRHYASAGSHDVGTPARLATSRVGKSIVSSPSVDHSTFSLGSTVASRRGAAHRGYHADACDAHGLHLRRAGQWIAIQSPFTRVIVRWYSSNSVVQLPYRQEIHRRASFSAPGCGMLVVTVPMLACRCAAV